MNWKSLSDRIHYSGVVRPATKTRLWNFLYNMCEYVDFKTLVFEFTKGKIAFYDADKQKICIGDQLLKPVALGFFAIAHELGHYISNAPGMSEVEMELAANEWIWENFFFPGKLNTKIKPALTGQVFLRYLTTLVKSKDPVYSTAAIEFCSRHAIPIKK